MTIFRKVFVSMFLLSLTFIVMQGANGKCGANLQWTLDKHGVLTIKGTGEMNNFSNSNQPWRPALVNEIVLDEGITSIGNNAFAGTRISTVTLPSTVTKIGNNAFKGCSKLVKVLMPYGLVSIGDETFAKCRILVNVQIPSSVRYIGRKSFAGCSLLSSIGLPDRLESIGNGVFSKCKLIEEITSLPTYINSNNCQAYGLPLSAVYEYERIQRQNNVALTNTTKSIGYVENADSIVEDFPLSNPFSIKYGDSDIDQNIPEKIANNSRTFAFIFANEKYSVMPDVPYALNDGKTFATYCNSTLGIPKHNINTYFNATYGNMKAAIEYLKQIDESFKGEINVIVYYAGHGAPDEKTSDAYLIPTDAYTVNSNVCYPLDDLYAELGSLKAKNIKVFMDACFSGTNRTNDMLAQGGRLVATVPKKASVAGNVVVVSATSNDQTAWYHKEQGHGLFTYCLIKKLQETKGELSMGELCDYLQERVPQVSIVQNRVLQNPTFQSSPTLGNSWKMWSIK